MIHVIQTRVLVVVILRAAASAAVGPISISVNISISCFLEYVKKNIIVAFCVMNSSNYKVRRGFPQGQFSLIPVASPRKAWVCGLPLSGIMG
jgi:hypothetical protein